MKSWLEKNAIEMYSAHNKEKSVVAERFINLQEQNLQIHDFSIKKCVY